MGKSTSLTALALQAATVFLQAYSSPTPTTSAPSSFVSATVGGRTYVNKGLVAFGLIPADFRESTGDTLGGIGSAIALKLGTWKAQRDGTFTGTLEVHPDRGFNVVSTIDYQSRQHDVDFVLSPYYGTANLSFLAAQKTLSLDYKKTTLKFERQDKKTSGLDALAVRPAEFGFQIIPLLDPDMPIANEVEQHLSLDVEGLVANVDGTYWISDEYGPYVYRYTADGHLIQTIAPPEAILPHDASGALNFTAETDPTTGRAGNQGFEGLSFDPSTNTLYAMLQSATIQDGGDSSHTSRYTRLLAYDVSLSAIIRPKLVGEWVVPLPVTAAGKTLACSEMHFLSPKVFLALSRDALGAGGSSNTSAYKQADLFDISQATDIHNSKFDSPANPIATGGVLDSSIKPAEYVSFLSLIDPVQLARFGLHNGDPGDSTLIASKWESLALAPVGDPAFPHDYFLFTAADNDFLTTNGISLGLPYDAGLNVDNQFMVFRVTIPGFAGQGVQL